MKLVTMLATAAIAASGLMFVPGCAQASLKVPATASEVALGHGDTAYRAGHSGTIYVYDNTYNKLRYTGFVHGGDTVSVDATSNRILVNGRPVVEDVPLDRNAEYRIYLDRGDRPVVREERTVIERSYSPGVERRTVIEREP